MILRKSSQEIGRGLPTSIALVTDFRRLNALTKSSTYGVPPLIREIIKQLSSAKIFSASDVVGEFYQQTLAEEDRDKTTFVCHTAKGERKRFRFRVSCLGLAGAPAAYQFHMEDVLQEIHRNGVLIYIDDFLYLLRNSRTALRYYCKSVRKIVETRNLFTPAKMRTMSGG